MSTRPTSFGFPINGRDDSLIAIGRTLDTAIEGYNVRSKWPVTGRLGGGRREGMEPACSSSVGAAIGRAAASLVADRQHVSYAVNGSPDVLWSAQGPSGRDAHAVRVDNNGDNYTLEGGTHVVVRNSAGTEQARIVLPVGTAGQVCRALAVDPDLRKCFVGVSEGGTQASARLWCYTRDAYAGWMVLWELPIAMYVEKLALSGDTLVAGCNDTDTGRSYTVAYDNLSTFPTERWRTQVPAPVTGLCLSPADGDIAVSSGTNAQRGLDPRHPETGQVLDRTFSSYWFDDLDSWESRRWCLFDPAEMDLNDGDDVFRWSDVNGSQRSFDAVLSSIKLDGMPATLVLSANMAPGDTVTFALPDGTVSETYTFVAGPVANDRDVLIGGTATATVVNFQNVLDSGGDGTRATLSTEPSTLVNPSIPSGASLRVKCNLQHDIVLCSETSAVAAFNRSRTTPEKTVTGTPPKFRKNGLSGRPHVYMNGTSNRLETLINATKATAAAEQQHTFYPGYGNNYSTASSGRFVTFAVFKPYTRDRMACPISQRVDLSASTSWIRRITSNRNASGVYANGSTGVTENDGGTLRTHAADVLSGTSSSGFVMVTQVSNPTGDYEVYINGTAAPNATAATIGTAVANDSLNRTSLGQAFQVTGEEQGFWEGEILLLLAVHDPNSAPMTTAERQIYEGAIAWYFGEQRQLPAAHPYYSVPPSPPTGTTSDWYTARKVLTTTPIVTKLDGKSREIAWMAASQAADPNRIGALGSGLAFLSTGDLVSIGPPLGSDTASVRLLVDGGTDLSLGWGAILGSGAASDSFTYDKLELAVDSWDNVYIPFQCEGYAAAYPPLLLVYDADGTLLLSPDSSEGRAAFSVAPQVPQTEYGDDTIERPEKLVVATRREATTILTLSTQPANGDQVSFSGSVAGTPVVDTYTFVTTYAVPFDVEIGATIADTLDALKAAVNLTATRSGLVTATERGASTLTFAQRLYDQGDVLASSTAGGAVFDPVNPSPLAISTDNVLQLELVSSTITGDTGRERVQVQVVAGDVWKWGDTYAQVATGGVGALSASARYYHAVEQWGRVFITDGKTSVVYDSRTDAVTPYVATDGGEIPQRFQIIEQYRARLLFAGISGAPWSIRGTRVGRPFDMQRDPGVIDGTQSFDTEVAIAGRAPDAINGIAPLGDDYAVIFGDRSLTLLRGDPAPGANGQFDDIPSGGTGGAFGRAWCSGPGGQLFYWGSDGEMKVMSYGSAPKPVVGERFRRTFQEIDLAKFYIRMRWNARADGIDIVACPYGGVNERSRAFRWERQTGAVWEDVRTSSDLDFGDLIVIDGDNTADQKVVFTCADGVPRTWNASATSDDGHAFEGMVAIGPIGPKDDNVEALVSQLQVLLDRSSAECAIEIWTSETPDTKGSMRYRSTLRAGLNPVLPWRVCGNFVFLVVRGQEPWGMQMVQAVVTAGGARRARVTA